MTGTNTAAGRPAYVVNVETFLHRDGRWLLIRRSAAEAHAAGDVCGVGGKVEAPTLGPEVLEETARREVAEEIGVELDPTALRYVESSLFVTADGDDVINIVFTGPVPAEAVPVVAEPDEVAEILWLTLDEALAEPACQPWTRRALERAAAIS